MPPARSASSMRRLLESASRSITSLGQRSPRKVSVPSPKYPVKGFSTMTWQPWRSASTATASWAAGGAHTLTTSQAPHSASSVSKARMWRSTANFSQCSRVGDHTPDTSTATPYTRRAELCWNRAANPEPTNPIFTITLPP